MYILTPFSIGLIAVGVVNLFLAFTINSVRPRQAFHTWAALLMFWSSIWSFGIAAFLAITHAGPTAEFIVRSYYFAAATIAYVLLGLVRSFPRSQGRHPYLFAAVTLIYAASIVLIWWGGLVQGVHILDGQHTAMLGEWQYALYVVYFMVMTGVASIVLAHRLTRANRKNQRRIKLQLRTMTQGLLIALGFGVIFNLILPLFGNYTLIWIGPPFTLVFVGFVVYGIIRHGLFDVRLTIVRTVAYVLSISSLGVLYILFASVIFQQSGASSPLSIILALLLAFLFQPIRIFFDKVTQRVFYRTDYNVDELLARLSHKLARANDLRPLLEKSAHIIAEAFKSEYAAFFIMYGERRSMSAGTQAHHAPLDAPTAHMLQKYFAETSEPYMLIEPLIDTKWRTLKHDLEVGHIAMIVPIGDITRVPQFLVLGDKQVGYYTARDLRVLLTIKDELAIAIQNALSVQEVKELNATLQQRIDDATEELRRTNEKLTRLDAAKDEFVSMASHQLRTPLTSVKGYISMVLEGDAGKITVTQRKLLDEAFTSSERMVHLIADFLNVSRLQTGKFLVERRPIDLTKLIEQEVDSLRTTATSRTLKLEYHKPSYFPEMELDEAKIRQVVMNFIDNALYYSHEHTTIDVTLTRSQGFAEFTVRDTGIGVPKAEQAHLFTKFFRAVNARKQRPDGTGVGLFLCKKIIDAHGGTIIFESIEGQGSTFGFRLPLRLASKRSHKLDD